jgi:hypothetical protein
MIGLMDGSVDRERDGLDCWMDGWIDGWVCG